MSDILIKLKNKELKGSILGCIIGLFLVSVVLIVSLELWRADLGIPFNFVGDSLSTNAIVKTVVDYGWYIENPSLGAPYELNMNDYPLGGDNLNFVIIKIISFFSNDYAVVSNVFYLLTFYLAFLFSYFVFRELQTSPMLSVAGSLLFTFLPYHYFRGSGGHLFLTCYYGIPLVILIAKFIVDDKYNYSIFKFDKEKKKITILGLISSAIIASTGVYYAFFTIFLWFVAGIYTVINKKTFKSFYNSILLICFTVGILIINYFPTLYFKLTHPTNLEAANRSPVDAEIYGLKIIQLFLPILGHRINKLNEVAHSYFNTAPLVNENHTVSLGILGSLGFIVLILFLFVRNNLKNHTLRTIQDFSIFNISVLLLSTIGGMGSIFAFAVTPSIRGYNRVLPIIAFLSFFAFISILQIMKSKVKIPYRAVLSLLICILVVLGLLDQTSKSFVPQYDSLKAEYINDHLYFARIERSVKSGSVFQLPYAPFPESPNINNMGGYEPLKAYMHTTASVKWSYGALRGSTADITIREISSKPIKELVDNISLLGFKGILLDRNGYEDSSGIERELISITGATPFISENSRYFFVKLD
ncbi:hypothetical protein [Paenibacillus solani]|uniref:hypothetical protein n=1 Tax=Paenibacillus solani TaxID=1705565 RepID=UPI003D2E56D1